MNALVPIALFGWIPVVLGIYTFFPSRTALLISIIGGWLFLPIAGYEFPGIPDFNKTTASCVGVLLGTLIFDPNKFFQYRPCVSDIPMLLWAFSPFMASISNGYGVYDGLSVALIHIIQWGVPFFLGRIYFNCIDDLNLFAKAFVIGGLIYVPLCLIEIRMSPQLHTWIYGYHQHDFIQSYRMGGWRPTVFMQHGLMVSVWMMSSSLICFWLWYTKTVRRIAGIKVLWCVLLISTTFILCKSTGAIALWIVGLLCLLATKRIGNALPLWILLSATPIYLLTRISSAVSTESVLNVAKLLVNEERVQSLEFRLLQEDRVIQVALERPLFGWGSWGPGQDQLWLLIFRNQGAIALFCMVLVLSLPAILYACRTPRLQLASSAGAASVSFSVITLLFCIDCLFNAMVTPVFTMAAGAVIGVHGGKKSRFTIPWQQFPELKNRGSREFRT